MKICRCYLKDYPKWTYYDHSLDKQRELILNTFKELALNGFEDDEIDEYIPYDRTIHSTGGGEARRFGQMIDWTQVKSNKKRESVYVGGRFSKEDSRWMRKKRNPDKKIRAKIYWYVDFEGRENLKSLIADLENKVLVESPSRPKELPPRYDQEWFYSADFTENYSKYDVEPDSLVMESTKEAIFYQTIFEMIWNGNSLGEIVEAVSTDDMTITRTGVANYKKQLEL